MSETENLEAVQICLKYFTIVFILQMKMRIVKGESQPILFREPKGRAVKYF